MKISLNWLREFLDIHKSPSEIADILTSLGLEVEGWETVKPSPVDLDQVLTGLVVECAPIPDTDHLSATQVDVGNGRIHSVVCGAPNVAKGQKVLLALPGAQVFSKDGSLFTIGERKVRGVLSQGMICAEDELGLGHDHSGILVLAADTPLGRTASEQLSLPSDTVFEIGLTPNRGDAASHRGVARDLLAWLRTHEQPEAALLHPVAASEPGSVAAQGEKIKVKVENFEACPRYTGLVIEGLKVQESPDWLKNRLLAVGQRPINNVVDVTNYIRLSLGQPLHAFDLAKIKGGEVLVKTLPEGTPFVTLDGTERKLFAEDLMICDGASTPMCIGGVFGGANSGVTDNTTGIFLESACFDARWIRRTMLRHGLRTDAAWNFEKGVDPNGSRDALLQAARLIQEVAGGTVAAEVIDLYPKPIEPMNVAVRYDHVNSLIGEILSPSTIQKILTALDIQVVDETVDGFTAIVPTAKSEVLREADIIEEIVRVYGLDNVALPGYLRSSIEITPKPDPQAIQNFAANFLADNGFLECMSLSLSNSAYYEGEKSALPLPKESLVFVHNTANQGLDCLRPTLVFSGLDNIRYNQHRQNPDLRLFEFGKTYRRVEGEGLKAEGDSPSTLHPLPSTAFRETLRLAIFITGAHAPESWQPSTKKAADYYTLKASVQNLLARLGISGYQESAVSEAPFQYALRYHRGPSELVTFGAVQPAILKKADVKSAVFFADFNFENLLKALPANPVNFSVPSRFPSVRRDLALVIDRSVNFGEVRQLALRTAKKILKEVDLFDVFEDESKLGAGKKSYAVSFLFEDPEKTLQDKEIDGLMGQLQGAFEAKLKAVIRK